MDIPAIGAVVDYQYDTTIVALSFLVSILGSYVALTLASAKGKTVDLVFGPALALGGCAIWAMHFIAMIAYKAALPISFSMPWTLASLAVAVVLTGTGFHVATRKTGSTSGLLLGGATIGIGAVAMHYMGMLGMQMSADITWNPALIAVSVVIAVVAATVALWLAFNVKSTAQKLGAAVVMGVAVCTMHYVGMGSATLICTASSAGQGGLGGSYLAYMVFLLALILLGASLAYNTLLESTQTT